MNCAKPSSSKGYGSPTASQSAPELEDQSRQNRKRLCSSPKPSKLENNGGAVFIRLEPGENSDFMCSICTDYMNEPTITECGHTFCNKCIHRMFKGEGDGRCPKCWTVFSEDKLVPNLALNDVMARARRSAVKTEILESTVSISTSPSTDVVKLLSSGDYDNLDLNDLDKLLLVLNRKREVKATNDEESKRKLLHEFLTQLLKLKTNEIEQLQREVELINRDLSALKINAGGLPDGVVPSKKNCSSSSDIGFNTQSRNIQKQSLASRKMRMYHHFDDLTQLYFGTRNAETFDLDASLPGQVDDDVKLNNFGKTLSHITQYHSMKPLATLQCSADLLKSNIVTSIEFDKDNEFFAIAGLTQTIKLYEYLNVIGTSDIHCPSVELECNARISCVAWNNYYKNKLASSDYDGCVSLWDVSASSRVRSIPEHLKRVWSVDWSKVDPRLLVSGSDDTKVKLWSTNSQRSVANLEAEASVNCVAFCPEKTFEIAFGCADTCVYYYDFRNVKKPLDVFDGHENAVSYVKFASKNELVSASTDNSLKLWSLGESNCIRSFGGHTNKKNFVGLATDGNYIACGSENNEVYLYHKFLPKPLFSFKFENHRGILGGQDESPFISAVTWKRSSPVVVAANSQGEVKILELI